MTHADLIILSNLQSAQYRQKIKQIESSHKKCKKTRCPITGETCLLLSITSTELIPVNKSSVDFLQLRERDKRVSLCTWNRSLVCCCINDGYGGGWYRHLLYFNKESTPSDQPRIKSMTSFFWRTSQCSTHWSMKPDRVCVVGIVDQEITLPHLNL